MTIYDIVKKLVGNIEPVGCTQTDNVRFENLENMTTLVELLLTDIDDVAYYFKDRHEDSLLKASKFASKFLNQIELRSKENIGE